MFFEVFKINFQSEASGKPSILFKIHYLYFLAIIHDTISIQLILKHFLDILRKIPTRPRILFYQLKI